MENSFGGMLMGLIPYMQARLLVERARIGYRVGEARNMPRKKKKKMMKEIKIDFEAQSILFNLLT